MSSSYISRAAGSRGVTPQGLPARGREAEQVRNAAGGFTFALKPIDRLRRFLILGSEGGSYYASETKLTRDNLTNLDNVIVEIGVEAVEVIAQVSESGIAPKNDPALFALAVASASPDLATRKAAWTALPRVARTGTHLFHYVEFLEGQRGWGRGARAAVGNWYAKQPLSKVAYQAVKYRQRDGWSHRDLIRLAHPGNDTPERAALYDWISRGDYATSIVKNDALTDEDRPLAALEAYERAQAAGTASDTVALIGEYGGLLPREALRTEHLKDPDVNRALLAGGMPFMALVRNLANMTRYGVLKPMGEDTQRVVARLTDEDVVRKSRIHPLQVLSALMTYSSGHSMRGSSTWTPIGEVNEALEQAFYAAFANVPVTGKRTMLALDVSASMTHGEIAGVQGVNPRVGSAVMAMATARGGDPYMTFAFSQGFLPINLRPNMGLEAVMRAVSGLPFQGTDCALPMVYAEKNRIEVDTFVVYTDSETWAGNIHPFQALRSYRQRMGIDAKMVVVGMTSNGFTIADPQDPGMLDVVGFDSSAPAVIAEFSAGRL